MSPVRPTLPGRCGALALALVTAVDPAPALAAHARVGPELTTPSGQDVLAVLPIEVVGKLPAELPRALEERLAGGLRRSQLAVVTADAVRARLPTAGCPGDCMRDAAVEAGATHLVRAKIAVEGRDYVIHAALVRADSGEQLASTSERCEVCGPEELDHRIDDVAGTVHRKMVAGVEPPRLRVFARPAGSVVSLDGEVVGAAPVDLVVPPGEHDVVITRGGFVSERRRLTLIDGVVETVDTDLVPVAAEPRAPAPERRRMRTAPLGWSAIALGVAATASGAALAALDERPIRSDCAGINVDADGDCKWRHDTLAGGITLVVTGVAAIALGAVLVARERRRGKRSAAAAAWGPGLGLRF